MEIKENVPIVVFDNQCYLCVKFAKFVDFFARGKIAMVGHYSDFGIKIRNEILDESALDMFWFIDYQKLQLEHFLLFPYYPMVAIKLKFYRNRFLLNLQR